MAAAVSFPPASFLLEESSSSAFLFTAMLETGFTSAVLLAPNPVDSPLEDTFSDSFFRSWDKSNKSPNKIQTKT